DERAALVQVRMDAVGVIDFNQGKVSLDATLYDSRILEFTLTGDMALRASWGTQPGFILAIGGWEHPFLSPPALASLDWRALEFIAGRRLATALRSVSGADVQHGSIRRAHRFACLRRRIHAGRLPGSRCAVPLCSF